LQVINLFDTLDKPFQVERVLRDENDVRAAVGGAQRQISSRSCRLVSTRRAVFSARSM
jgi:hypothetical protein